MAHKKKGHLTTSIEWAKHLRKYMKNRYWSAERNAAKSLIRSELEDYNANNTDSSTSQEKIYT